MAKGDIYLDAACFTELACHSVGQHKTEREDDIAFLKQILQASFKGELKVYTSILSVAECQCALTPTGTRILNDDIKKLLRDILMSGQFVILVQDSVLVAEKARNLYWVHQLTFKGADAIHVASGLEMGCDEFLTFDKQILNRRDELEALGMSPIIPRKTKNLASKEITAAAKINEVKDQQMLPGLEESSVLDATQTPLLEGGPTSKTMTASAPEESSPPPQ